MSREDGGPLDPPEVRQFDAPDFLRSRACGACGRTDGWREVSGRSLLWWVSPLWTCECGEDSWTEDRILEALADEDQAAQDDADNLAVDSARDGGP